jgi:hypothetical protein
MENNFFRAKHSDQSRSPDKQYSRWLPGSHVEYATKTFLVTINPYTNIRSPPSSIGCNLISAVMNDGRLSADLMDCGSRLHRVGPAVKKARSPKLLRVAGTWSKSSVSALITLVLIRKVLRQAFIFEILPLLSELHTARLGEHHNLFTAILCDFHTTF